MPWNLKSTTQFALRTMKTLCIYCLISNFYRFTKRELHTYMYAFYVFLHLMYFVHFTYVECMCNFNSLCVDRELHISHVHSL